MAALPTPRKLLYAALTTLGLLLAGEVAARAFGQAQLRAWASPPPLSQDGAPTLRGNPYLLFEYAPGVRRELGVEVRINSLGLRGPEWEVPKPPGARRLMTTGDSSVFGFGVPEEAVFSSVAARAVGGQVQAINAAIPGYSTYQSVNLLRLRAMRLEPDLLVIGNLWSDNNFDSFVDEDLLATTAGYAASPAARLQRALEPSALYRLLDWKLRVERQARKIRTVSWQVGSARHVGRRRVEINDYAANLEALARMAEEAGAEVIFLLLANEEDVPSTPASALGGQKAWDPYRQVMRDAAARHGAPVIDVPALFQASGLPTDALFLDEMHPTAEGHRRIGEALARLLADAGWADGGSVMGEPARGPLPRYEDPFVQAHAGGAPVTGLQPGGGARVDGLVRFEGYTGGKLLIEALPAGAGGGEALGSVALDGPRPFTLAVREPLPAVLRVTIDAAGDGADAGDAVIDLSHAVLSLDQGSPRVLIDLDRGVVEGAR